MSLPSDESNTNVKTNQDLLSGNEQHTTASGATLSGKIELTNAVAYKSPAYVLLSLFFYSFAMFTLPFLAYFGTKHLVEEIFLVDTLQSYIYGVISSVIVVNTIVALYARKAYNEEFSNHRKKNL